MIKFFRKIRQNLLMENKTSKYFKYAIGEIILVVIGILIALQINNWNQGINSAKKESDLLTNLKEDLINDLQLLKEQDSSFSIKEKEGKQAIELFYKAKTVKDIDSVLKLINARWNVLYMNNNTYNEMINTGSMYSLKNKTLQQLITRYYLTAEADKSYIKIVNQGQTELFNRSPDMYPFQFLVERYRNSTIDIKRIDTSWINNPNSKTYLAIYKYLSLNQSTNNTYRRSVYQRNIKRAKKLLKEVNKELESRN